MTFAELKALLDGFKAVESIAAELHAAEHPDDEPIPEALEARIQAALNPPPPAVTPSPQPEVTTHASEPERADVLPDPGAGAGDSGGG